jgi:hypothetical protein
MSMRSFSERMAEAKDNAANARYRGKHTGKSAPGWNWRRSYESRQDWALNQLYMEALKVGIDGEALIKLLPELKEYFRLYLLINDCDPPSAARAARKGGAFLNSRSGGPPTHLLRTSGALVGGKGLKIYKTVAGAVRFYKRKLVSAQLRAEITRRPFDWAARARSAARDLQAQLGSNVSKRDAELVASLLEPPQCCSDRKPAASDFYEVSAGPAEVAP